MPLQNLFTDGRATTASEVTRISDAIAGQTYAFSNAGGAVTPSSGMTIAIAATAAGGIVIGGTAASAYAGGTAVVTAADPTNPRRDLVVINTAGAVSILPGTPAALTSTTGPVLPTPSSTQFALAEVYVGAGVTSISAGNITDRRQTIPDINVAVATSTTSTSAVDLVTISGLNIPVTQGFRVVWNARKQALAANAVAFGIKINSTVVMEATPGTDGWSSSATNQAEDGIMEFQCAPRSAATYLNPFRGDGTWHVSATGAIAGTQLHSATITAPMPNAAITSIAIRAINGTASNAAEVTNVRISF